MIARHGDWQFGALFFLPPMCRILSKLCSTNIYFWFGPIALEMKILTGDGNENGTKCSRECDLPQRRRRGGRRRRDEMISISIKGVIPPGPFLLQFLQSFAVNLVGSPIRFGER